MIVLSTTLFDASSSDVIDWLGKARVLRINNDDVPRLFLEMELKIESNNHVHNGWKKEKLLKWVHTKN